MALATININSIVKTKDGGFVVAENSSSINLEFENKGGSDAMIVKYNKNNNLEWIKNFGGSNYYDTVEMYDPQTDKWETKASKPTARASFATGVIDGKIYCIGGRVNYGFFSEVEVYDPEEDSWETKKSMPVGVADAESVVIDGKIYILGGRTSSTLYTTLVRVYDPKTDAWTSVTSMPTRNTGFGAVVSGSKIYCIGGKNSNILDVVEMYNIETNTWETIIKLPTWRYNLKSIEFNNKIYCIGGHNNTYGQKMVEVYIPNINSSEYRAESSVSKAEQTKEPTDMENARNEVNKLPEGDLKEELQDRLDAIIPNIDLNATSGTANLDVYIKSENSLHMALSTNQISFENYSGVDEIEQDDAIEISINSSLPYELNAYLLDEMYDSSKTKKIDMNRLNIKDSSNITDTDYKEFTTLNTKLILNNDCVMGNDKKHNIDIKLKGGNTYPSDIYKTVIRFEVNQK